jgi:glutamate-1-semialdehyde 2,1-aminomutase
MDASVWVITVVLAAVAWAGYRLVHRLRLSRAKHPSLQGHSKISKLLARFLPFYEYGDDRFFASDGAPDPVAARRERGFERLERQFAERAPQSLEFSRGLEAGISDLQFINAYRVPFQFRNRVRARLRIGAVVTATDGNRVEDLDGNSACLSRAVPVSQSSQSAAADRRGGDGHRWQPGRRPRRQQRLGPDRLLRGEPLRL